MIETRAGQYTPCNINTLSRHTPVDATVDDIREFSRVSQRGGAPPGKEEGPGGAGYTAEAQTKVPSSKDAPTFASPESTDKTFLDWRSFYGNARGKIDHAIRSVWGALAAGLIGEEEAQQIDTALRQRQAAVALKPRGLGTITAKIGSAKSRLALGWPRRRPRRMPDREKSRERARILGSVPSAPPQIRAKLTECERAVATIVADEVRDHGYCDLSVGEIAARAGVSCRTVQNFEAEAVRLGIMAREERPQLGRPNLTNILRITSTEWLTWLKRGPARPMRPSDRGRKDRSATDPKDSSGKRFSQPRRASNAYGTCG